jgi:hypothetical protein
MFNLFFASTPSRRVYLFWPANSVFALLAPILIRNSLRALHILWRHYVPPIVLHNKIHLARRDERLRVELRDEIVAARAKKCQVVDWGHCRVASLHRTLTKVGESDTIDYRNVNLKIKWQIGECHVWKR